MIAKSKVIQDDRGLLKKQVEWVDVPKPEFVYIPQENARCAKAEVYVKEGDHVLLGQLIGQRKGPFFEQNIHSTVSGTVVGFEKHGYRNGKQVTCIKIQNDFKDEKDPDIYERSDEEIAKLSTEEITELVQKASMVGLGGSSFPTYIKFQTKDKINTIVINGVECEPYLSADQRLMEEKTEELLKGCVILQQAFHTSDVRICVKAKHAELIAHLRKAIEGFGVEGIVVSEMDNYYPQGWEVETIEKATGIRLNTGELPAKRGIIDFNVASVVGIYMAVKFHQPVYERYLAIMGDACEKQVAMRVRVGTLISELLPYAGKLSEEPKAMILGGPMMGSAITNEDCVVSKTITSILLLLEKPVEENPCIRCGSCVLSCPAHLQPVLIMNAVKSMDKDMIKALNPLACVECGLCTYSCTSGIRVTDYIRRAKLFARL